MTARYTTYRLNKAGAIVESKAVTSAADVDAFETARAAYIAERERLLSEICLPAGIELPTSLGLEDAA